jgi:hypothetical protein
MRIDETVSKSVDEERGLATSPFGVRHGIEWDRIARR